MNNESNVNYGSQSENPDLKGSKVSENMPKNSYLCKNIRKGRITMSPEGGR